MGLFNLLKNGLTIEKKKGVPEPENNTEESNIDTEEETSTEAVAVMPEPASMPAPQPTAEDKRLEAASVLYGDNGLTSGSTPSLIQVAQSQTNNVAAQATLTTQAPVETPTAQPQIFNTHNNQAGNFDNALLGQVSANQNLLVIAPQTSAEISTILTNLANGNACIVSLSKFPLPDAQRFLDYICGFVNAIGGMIMQKTSSEYILAPKGVNIKNS